MFWNLVSALRTAYASRVSQRAQCCSSASSSVRKTPLAASVLGVAVGKAGAAVCVLASDAPTRRHAGEGKWSQHEQTEERPFAKSGRGFCAGKLWSMISIGGRPTTTSPTTLACSRQWRSFSTPSLRFGGQLMTMISLATAEAIADGVHTIWFTSASACELAVKVRTGKLGLDIPRLVNQLTQHDVRVLGIGIEDAVTAGGLEWSHRDPFDRMPADQTVRLNLTPGYERYFASAIPRTENVALVARFQVDVVGVDVDAARRLNSHRRPQMGPALRTGSTQSHSVMLSARST